MHKLNMKIDLTKEDIELLLDICQGCKLSLETDRYSYPDDIMEKMYNRIDSLINKLSEKK